MIDAIRAELEAEVGRLAQSLHDARDVVAGLSQQLQLVLSLAKRGHVPDDVRDDSGRAIARARAWSAGIDPARVAETMPGPGRDG